MSNENEGDNKFGWDLRGKKKIAFLEGQLKKTQEDLDAEKEETSWVTSGKDESKSNRLPIVRVNDSQFIEIVASKCGYPSKQVKEVMDCIEKEIPSLISLGQRAVTWYGLGTYYAVYKRGAWRPKVRFSEPVKKAVKA